VESLAEGGGISISGTAYDQLGKKLPLGYEYLGEQSVKNIEKPVRVYRILTEAEAAGKVIGEKRLKPMPWRWAAVAAVIVILVAGVFAVWNFYLRPTVEPASVERMAFPLPDKPSIAVLPFKNLSGDPEQEFLADGITESIIGAISRISSLFVIASNSVFTYKGKAVKIQTVSEELGVRNILEGTVQRIGNRLRIHAQLIDATTGGHLWSEKYDREMKDLFSVQDNISKEVLTALRVKIVEGEQARVWAKGTSNIEAYLKFLRAYDIFKSFNKENTILARQICEEAIALDPNYDAPYGLIGVAHLIDLWFHWGESPRASIKKSEAALKKAVALNPLSDYAWANLGHLYLMQRRYDESVAAGEKSIELNPNGDYNMILLGITFNYVRRYKDAITLFKEGQRRNPYCPAWYIHNAGVSYRGLGRWDEAIVECQRALNRNPDHFPALNVMASVYGMAGRLDEGRAVVEKILKMNPKYSIAATASWPFKHKSDAEAARDGLRKVGIPETPALPLPDKPSIAVLPFVNMSGDPEQEYFSDGITEEIITALSKTPKMFVIARTSSFKYKGKEVDVRTVGRELGVRHVLEGSVRIADDKIRITAQLVDAKTGIHLWGDRYDRDLKDIFAIQDEITMKVIRELQVKLTMGEHARVFGRGTSNLKAYLKVLQGREYLNQVNREDNVRARQAAEQAIALDPGYATAYEVLAFSHYIDFMYRSSKSPQQSLARASELAYKTLAIDESNGGARALLSNIYLLKREHEKAIVEMEKARELNPSSARIHMWLGRALCYAGRPAEAIQLLEKVLRMDPMPGTIELNTLGRAYRDVGQYDEAIATCKKAIKIAPKNQWAHITLTSAYSLSGREQEARAQAAEVLKVNPKFSLAYFAKTSNYKNRADTERVVIALRKAGLK
jgi:adenylate cyclase